jgi:hypothetical protein
MFRTFNIFHSHNYQLFKICSVLQYLKESKIDEITVENLDKINGFLISFLIIFFYKEMMGFMSFTSISSLILSTSLLQKSLLLCKLRQSCVAN